MYDVEKDESAIEKEYLNQKLQTVVKDLERYNSEADREWRESARLRNWETTIVIGISILIVRKGLGLEQAQFILPMIVIPFWMLEALAVVNARFIAALGRRAEKKLSVESHLWPDTLRKWEYFNIAHYKHKPKSIKQIKDTIFCMFERKRFFFHGTLVTIPFTNFMANFIKNTGPIVPTLELSILVLFAYGVVILFLFFGAFVKPPQKC